MGSIVLYLDESGDLGRSFDERFGQRLEQGRRENPVFPGNSKPKSG
jgi:hypothetical protein